MIGYYPINNKNEIIKFLNSLDCIESNINFFFIFILPKVSEKDEMGKVYFKFVNKIK